MMKIKWKTKSISVAIVALSVCLSAVLIWNFGSAGPYAISGGNASPSENAESNDEVDFLEWRLLPLSQLVVLNESTSSAKFLELRLESLGKTVTLERASWMEPVAYYRVELVDKTKTSAFDITANKESWQQIMESDELTAKTVTFVQNNINDIRQLQKRIRLDTQRYSNVLNDSLWTAGVDPLLVRDMRTNFALVRSAYQDENALLDYLIEIRNQTLESIAKKDVIGALRADRDVESVNLILAWYDAGIVKVNTAIVDMNNQYQEVQSARMNELNGQIDGLLKEIQNLQDSTASSTLGE